MTTTSKILRLTFINAAGKKRNLNVPEAAEGLEAYTVKAAMEKMAQNNAFADENGDLYTAVDSAAYVERTVNSVFDNSEDK
ncbi:MAG: DUF2922 domain-containing protein [Lactobacillus sp.]|jgi:hypothetical protein|nr:DUF2922 domain-containing protein [Lactobacillus sp.]MCH3905765.1 DUF2922 domain-containing protein [Lactobacillus sp.]MCH3990666.1 DUF2922 domain-containing protein [Lactobacillus sp.]MCH4068618.1 DUF2922 domain-containing protein [Lactobacillus sp.]MCI1304087.1 DUF2922 domain-containing protein [Lactobacillus sp.]